MKEMQLRDAKAAFSSVVDLALAGEPTVVTRHGKKAVVVVAAQEYERLAKVPSFGALLSAFPGIPDDIPERDHSPSRDFDI